MYNENHPLIEGLALESLFEKQTELMKNLHSKGLLFEHLNINTMGYLNINTPDAQNHIRMILGFFIEELTEAQESFEKIVEAFDLNPSKPIVKNQLQAYNEELADCAHFILEILVLSGVTPPLIKDALIRRVTEDNLVEAKMIEEDTLMGLFNYAHTANIFDRIYPEARTYHNLGKFDPSLEDNPWLAAGKKLSPQIYDIQKQMYWDLIRGLFKTFSDLKKKPWRLGGKDIDIENFRGNLIVNFIEYIRLAVFLGQEHTDFYLNYEAKNNINKQRIDDKY